MGEAKTLTEKMWANYEKGALDEVAKLMDEDIHFAMPGFEGRGRNAMMELLRVYRGAFPDIKHTMLDHVESGDTVAIEVHVEGTNTGAMQMPQGTIPPSGRRVVWKSCDYIRVRNGKLISWHVYHDPRPFLEAVGLLGAGPK